VTNRFSKLKLEELADQDLEQPTKAATQKPATPPKVTYVVGKGKEKRWIAMNFLLHDFTCIKSILYVGTEKRREKVIVLRELQRAIIYTRELGKQAIEDQVSTAFTVY
jgi:hypothetical protein